MGKIVLRELAVSDAPFMYEWMKDGELVQHLGRDYSTMTENDCVRFIHDSKNVIDHIHCAVDVNGEYMGTVSLKNIDQDRKCAEFAIVLRRCAMGKGYALVAMKEMLWRGFSDLKLQHIYWYVSSANQRAIRFYDKNGFQQAEREQITGLIGSEQYDSLPQMIWYLEELLA